MIRIGKRVFKGLSTNSNKTISVSDYLNLVQNGEVRQEMVKLKQQMDEMVLSHPAKNANIPSINWDFWRQNIRTAGVVDRYKASYESIKIPKYDRAPLFAEFNKEFEGLKVDAEKEVNEIKERIVYYEKQLEAVKNAKNPDELTLDELLQENEQLAAQIDAELDAGQWDEQEEEEDSKNAHHH